MPNLTITGGPLAGQQFSFSESAVIGRGAYSDIRIDDSTVSRRHAEMICGSDGIWRIHDLGSANGILYRGQPLRGELRIEGSVDLVIGEVAVTVNTVDSQTPRQGAESSFPQLVERIELLAWIAAVPARREGAAVLISQVLEAVRDRFVGCQRISLFVTRPGSRTLVAYGQDQAASDAQRAISLALAQACLRHVDGVAGGASVIEPLGVAGAPTGILAAPVILGGETMGVMVAESERSDTWNPMDRSLAKGIASVLAGLLEAERGNHPDRRVAERDLLLARRVQQHFLPQSTVRLPGYQLAEAYVPARVVGGDHYDYFHFTDGRVGMVIADVSGKAVSAALVMARFGMAMRLLANQAGTPLDLLVTLNILLIEELEAGMFVTAQVIALDVESGAIEIANAGHPPPLLRAADGKVEQLVLEPGAALGANAQTRFCSSSIILAHGDCLLLFTDGLDEAQDIEGEQFGIERAMTAMKRAGQAPAILAEINKQLDAFVGSADAADDLTLLLLSRD
ncbi:MAG: SpoIIE family protein phosphatase [Xanthomonadales bacterium]|nr:SpoIIE family protein phosphatase [Xanthomonadales bacterium]